MIPAKRFYMIRHGQTEHNAARLMAGHTDSPLTETGKLQARQVQEVMRRLEEKPKVIVHSNLSRARDTAGIINEVLGVPMHEDPDIAEHYCGDWEGLPYEECESMLTGWDTPPNGESFEAFCARIARSKTNTLNTHDNPALIVCHGGVFRAFGKLYGLNTPGVFKNCHLYEFMPAPEEPRFPWRVWSYGLDQDDFREETRVYHDSDRLDEDR